VIASDFALIAWVLFGTIVIKTLLEKMDNRSLPRRALFYAIILFLATPPIVVLQQGIFPNTALSIVVTFVAMVWFGLLGSRFGFVQPKKK
jgi:uncharacterized membrane protein